ncbi:hypothetical protein RB620_11385 [Paenibacillus sp. LHD-117]|uniref:hypothetical protein n=1 Tax=Paenibacillus sp. LHD-117 TaxID=3071412 RepID=UPI0027E0DAC1|nr:hypothetical protein [Paenibacillus sp. LHD-117]MDQ6420038.1 hypothetical protein [Paenibacillus sp. LHD-117]
MPDWSYQTLFRPLLFRLPSRMSRAFTLGAMGAISRMPAGSFVIRTLGHMEPSPLLNRSFYGMELGTPIGLSGGVDPSGTAQRALSQFGFGFVEVGPVTVRPLVCDEPIGNDPAAETIRYPSYYENAGADAIAERMRKPGHKLPQFARIAPMPGSSPDESLEELRLLMRRLGDAGAAGFFVDVASGGRPWDEVLAILTRLSCQRADTSKDVAPLPMLLYMPLWLSEDRARAFLSGAEDRWWSGVVVGEAWREESSEHGKESGRPARGELSAASAQQEGQSENDCRDFPITVGAAGFAPALRLVSLIRETYGASMPIIAGAGAHEPYHALLLRQAGADFIQLHSGLVYSGPGLPKRMNEAVIYETVRGEAEPKPPSFWRNWGWMCLLGIGMIIGGALAWWIGATKVLLSYDLDFLGMTKSEIFRVNPHLLHFMAHDRITLAGTMISIGILYYSLARYGLRDGQHWARTALATSGIVGFSSFFLYLGYGYFDPLHATAAAVLLPMFILSMRGHADRPDRKPVNLRNDAVWRRAMWGQLCLVVLGFALAVGGLTIAGVGITDVFVKTDLLFLRTTPETINQANPKLISLIAHDRAGFGGALLCDALAILIAALWGIGQGRRWLWWTLLLGGIPGFYAGFSVHYRIGYTSLLHLSPAIFAVLLFIAGLILLYPYMITKQRPMRRHVG